MTMALTPDQQRRLAALEAKLAHVRDEIRALLAEVRAAR